jgi:hypothetical protein
MRIYKATAPSGKIAWQSRTKESGWRHAVWTKNPRPDADWSLWGCYCLRSEAERVARQWQRRGHAAEIGDVETSEALPPASGAEAIIRAIAGGSVRGLDAIHLCKTWLAQQEAIEARLQKAASHEQLA